MNNTSRVQTGFRVRSISISPNLHNPLRWPVFLVYGFNDQLVTILRSLQNSRNLHFGKDYAFTTRVSYKRSVSSQVQMKWNLNYLAALWCAFNKLQLTFGFQGKRVVVNRNALQHQGVAVKIAIRLSAVRKFIVAPRCAWTR